MTDTALQQAIAQVKESSAPVVRTFFDEPTFTATHVVHDPATKRAAIIDSGANFDQPSGRMTHVSADAVIAYVRAEGLTVD